MTSKYDDMSTTAAPTKTAPRTRPRRLRRWVLLGGGLLVLLLLLGWGLRSLWTVQRVQQQARDLAALAGQPLDDTTLATARATLDSVAADMASLRTDLTLGAPLVAVAGYVPGISDTAQAADPLLTTGEHVVVALDELLTLVEEVRGADVNAATLVETLQSDETTARLFRADAALQRAHAAYASVPPRTALLPVLDSPVRRLETALYGSELGTALLLAGHHVAPVAAPVLLADDPTATLFDPQQVRRLAAASGRVQQAETAVARAYAAHATLQPLLGRNNPQLATLQQLIIAADSSVQATAAGHHLARGVAPLLTGDVPLTPDAPLVAALEAAAADFAAAGDAAANAERAANRLDVARLPGAVRPLATRLQREAGTLRSATSMAQVLPALLGSDAPRRYLLLLQNPDELRPTGGFISGAGTLTFERGAIADYVAGDVSIFDDFSQPYPFAPEPLQRAMGIQLWTLRDTNWSPNLPTAAADVEAAYLLSDNGDIDGVIALTPAGIEALLGVLGGVPVALSPAPVTAATLRDYLREAWAPPPSFDESWAERKSRYVRALADGLVSRVQQGVPVAQAPALLTEMGAAFDAGAVQVVMFDPAAAEPFARRNWDGAVRTGGQDFFSVIDANVGYNKANARLAQQATYRVDLQNPNAPTATADLTYTNQTPDAVPCVVQVAFLAGTYATMEDQCYWGYTRLLTPAGSQLTTASVPPIPPEQTHMGQGDDGAVTAETTPYGTREYGAMLLVPAAASTTATFAYTLPRWVVQRENGDTVYRLRLHPQAGRAPIGLTVDLTLPAGATLQPTSTPPTAQQGQQLTYTLPLDAPQTLEVRWR